MYKLNVSGGIIRLQDMACIPDAPDNLDYQAYAAWVADGNVAAQDAAPLPSAQEKIAALLAEAGETRLTIQMAIELCEDKAIAMGAELGMTAEASVAFAYAKNKAYRTCKDLEVAIQALEAVP